MSDDFKSRCSKFFSFHTLVVALIILIVVLGVLSPILLGTHGFGPTKTLTVKVTRTYVDVSTSGSGENRDTESHYMVATDQGVFEVANGVAQGVWNADELYAKFQPGHTYTITTKGNKQVDMFMQQYPYIIQVVEQLPPPRNPEKDF